MRALNKISGPAVLTLACATIALPAQLSLSDQSTGAGSSISLPLLFASEGAQISGLQFDIEVASSAMDVSAILGEPRNSWKVIYAADLGSQKRRFLIAGLNQTVLGDGALVNLFVNVDQRAANGTYALKLSNLVATDPTGNLVPVTGRDGSLTIEANQGTRLPTQGILNTASLLPGSIAPGELVTLTGSAIGPPSSAQPVDSGSSTVLLGTRVLFEGNSAPLLLAAPDQINAVVPYELYGMKSAQMEVVYRGQTIATVIIPVTPAAPAIFTQDGTGAGSGAILNENSSANEPNNPAERGSIVSIFATGAGQMNPPGVDGQLTGTSHPAPLLPVSVQIGGVTAHVLYAGVAPGLVSGILQVNAQVPLGVPSGPAVPIVLTVGAASSPEGVTLAVR